MDHIKNILFLLAALAVLMAGCQRETTVILPPDTDPTASLPVTEPSSVPTTTPTTPLTTAETTLPTSPDTSEPTTEPTLPCTSEPTAASTTPPTMEVTIEPTTSPALDPTIPQTTDVTTEPSTDPTIPSIYDHPIASLELELLKVLNNHRAVEELPELTIDQPLCALSAIRAGECVQSLSVSRPDGRDWSTVLSDYTYEHWSHAGEIRIYCSQGFPATILVDTWMSDMEAKENILSSNYSCCGIGTAFIGSSMYIVIIFTG